MMTPLEWIAFLVLLVSALGVGAVVSVSNGAVVAAIGRLERTYRQQKSLEIERDRAQEVQNRRAELEGLLSQPDAWRDVVHQVLADVFPAQAVAGQAGDWLTLVDVCAAPPQFAVAAQDAGGGRYLFTVSPDRAGRRWWALPGADRTRVIPLDGSLAPTARVEVEAVWRHLAGKHGLDPQALPRQAGWYLVV